MLATGVAASPALARIAKADDYPSRPIHLIVQTPPGGSPDIVGRLMAQWLSERLGQPVVVDNRAGASGNIATEFALKATPDGYTLLLAMSSNAINPSIYNDLHFNFMHDAAPVASISLIPLVMEVNPACRRRRFRNSSLTPRPIRARSTWRPAASARRCTSPANCSR